MSKESATHHKKAAGHHEEAAKHHHEAAKHHLFPFSHRNASMVITLHFKTNSATRTYLEQKSDLLKWRK